MVPAAVALFSSAVPCQGASLAYLARSDRITLMMYRPSVSKNAIPTGFSPNRRTLVPSLVLCSHESRIQVPTSFNGQLSVVEVMPRRLPRVHRDRLFWGQNFVSAASAAG